MPDDVEIPADLVQVYRAWWTAQTAVAAYEAAVAAERLALFPNPGGRFNEAAALQRREWPPEQLAELERLRAVRAAAFHDISVHPLAVQAKEAKTWKTIAMTLQKELLGEQKQS